MYPHQHKDNDQMKPVGAPLDSKNKAVFIEAIDTELIEMILVGERMGYQRNLL